MKVNLKDPKKLMSNIHAYQDHCKKALESAKNEEEKETYEMYIDLLERFIDNSAEYLNYVSGYSKKQATLKSSSNSAQDYRDSFEEFDKNRSISHTSCVISLAMLDRVCQRENLEPIYGDFGEHLKDTAKLTGPKSNMSLDDKVKRREIGNTALYFATYYTAGIFIDKIEKTAHDYVEGEDILAHQVVDSVLDDIKYKHGGIKHLLHEVTGVEEK